MWTRFTRLGHIRLASSLVLLRRTTTSVSRERIKMAICTYASCRRLCGHDRSLSGANVFHFLNPWLCCLLCALNLRFYLFYLNSFHRFRKNKTKNKTPRPIHLCILEVHWYDVLYEISKNKLHVTCPTRG